MTRLGVVHEYYSLDWTIAVILKLPTLRTLNIVARDRIVTRTKLITLGIRYIP